MSEIEWQRARWAAFRSSQGGEVFGSIAGSKDVWGHDPYDEETIHSEARQAFSDLIEVAADRRRGGGRGRIFLLLGDAGSGKTHLMGAFRRMVEETHAGCFAYAQMSTNAPDLTKYLLRNVIDSLQRSRVHSGGNQWLQLSDALVERGCVPGEEREALRNAENYSESLASIRSRLIQDLYAVGKGRPLHGDEREPIHEDFLTALLVLQRRDGNATSAAMRYLRGDSLSAENLGWLCSPHGLSGMGEPTVLLGWLISAVRDWGGQRGGAFVLCIDQIEEAYVPNAPEQGRFAELLSIIRALSENQPGFIAVLSCLQDYYTAMSGLLSRSYRDRLELDTKPSHLSNKRTSEEIVALVSKRLAMLDAEAGIAPPADADHVFPFIRRQLENLQGVRPRAVLTACHDAWQRNRRSEEPRTIEVLNLEIPTVVDPIPPPPVDWALKWNDHRSTWEGGNPKSPEEYADLLAWGTSALGQQTNAPLSAHSGSDLVHLTIHGKRMIAAICEGAAQGGRLSAQIKSLTKTTSSAGCPGIVVRSTELAKSPKAQVYEHFAELVKTGGRKTLFSEADWRTLQAFRTFDREHSTNSSFTQWKQSARPLAELSGLRDLVLLEDLLSASATEGEQIDSAEKDGSPAAKTSDPKATPDDTSPKPPVEVELNPANIEMGTSCAFQPKPVNIDIQRFTQHMAVLGGTGSGKTTLAMAVIEHLLLRGVPAILVDRKGDLARYADTAALSALPGNLGALFRDRVDVALYTPGSTDGRPLALSVLPAKNKDATTEETGTQAEDAANALGAMLGYGENRSHTKRRAALTAAVKVLLSMDDVPATLERLLDLMSSGDPALLQAMDYLDPKLLHDIVQDLDSFRKLNARLLGAGAEPLDAASLLGLGPHARAGKTRLTVISTKALGGNEAVQFWVAQLMMELARFASSRPRRELQAVVMLDEADLYLPAVGKPASKQPVENALRRFRSQGIGLILATQSPGDLDYRCRENIQTWLVGRVKETRALEKLRPVFGQEGADALGRLSQHATGEFCLVNADTPTRFQAHRNLLITDQMSDAEIIDSARKSRQTG